jgi:hypothetical protein
MLLRILLHSKRACFLTLQNYKGVGNYCSEFAAASKRRSNGLPDTLVIFRCP